MILTFLSIGAVSAVDGDVMADNSVMESNDDVELDLAESESPDNLDDDESFSEEVLQDSNDDRQELNRSYNFNPAEVDRDYPSIWINMEVDNPYDLGEGN